MAEREHLIRVNTAQPSYAEDYAAWLDAQLGMLRDGRYADLDLPNLIDEVESLGRSDFKAFVSAIEIVLVHMLKWDHQPERRSLGWIASIAEHRQRIADELEDSPSYRSRTNDAMERAFRVARAAAARETGLPLSTFPSANPYDWEAVTTREHQLGA